MLLPRTTDFVHDQSLRWHLAVAAFRLGKGNADLLAELVKVLYLSWYLQNAGIGDTAHEDYLEAERILEETAKRTSGNVWLIEPVDCAPIVRILDFHEMQLLAAPIYVVEKANNRLLHFRKGDKRSPW